MIVSGDAVVLTPRRSSRLSRLSAAGAGAGTPPPAHSTPASDRLAHAPPHPADIVFPKTDYTYSKYSKYHREISPGVMTAPNMSRPGIHSIQEPRVESQITPLRLSYEDYDFCSDTDEGDYSISGFRSIKRSLYSQQERPNLWARARSTTLTFLMSVLSLLTTTVSYVTERGSRIFSRRKRPAFVPKTPRYYSYARHHESMLSRMWSSVHSFFSNIYLWVNQTLVRDTWLLNSVRTSWTSHTSTRLRRCGWVFPFLLLVPLLILLGWWFWQDSSLSSLSEIQSYVLEYTRDCLWAFLEFPYNVIQSLISFIWIFVSTPISLALSSLPSAESFGFVYDMLYSPLWLIQSIWGLLASFTAPLLSTKDNTWQVPMDHIKPNEISEIQSDTLKVFLESALEKHEALLVSRMALHEKSLLAEMAANKGYQKASKEEYGQLHAKVSYLQDELRRLRRRMLTCCRRSEAASAAVSKESLQQELKQLLASPEGLILLGAATAAHSSSYTLDKTTSNMPQFNDSEIRAWVSTAFLDKDDIERALANISKHFHEELERRNSVMMAASAEEINAQIASQIQAHLNQLSKVKSYEFENDHLQTSATFSGATAASLDESRIRRIIDSAIALYDADKTGMADYALESQGGQVVSTRCTETYQVKSPTLSVFGVPLWYPSNSPRTVIQPGMHPGECWAFVGSQGFLVIQLSHRIRVKGFTYEHISPVLLPTGKMDSAPKEFAVNGLRSEGDNDPILLGNYHYHENGTSMQYFPVQRSGVQALQLIEIQVKSNHGNINYTCMYRFRVHGSIA